MVCELTHVRELREQGVCCSLCVFLPNCLSVCLSVCSSPSVEVGSCGASESRDSDFGCLLTAS